MVHINQDGSFRQRPEIGERYKHLDGEICIIAASWTHGVVFEGGKCCSGFDLIAKFDPECPECAAFHEPQYPHEFTAVFRTHIASKHGRIATREDTFAHCGGVIRTAVETACA